VEPPGFGLAEIVAERPPLLFSGGSMGQLDQQRERIQDDLRGLVSGDVHCNDVFVQMYASDGSIYEVRPLGVVRPRLVADIVACVQYAAEKEIPLHARGAGSGMAGESLGSGLVIDFTRYLNHVKFTGPDVVRVQPGLVHERLNAHLRTRGLMFGPDPSGGSVSTIGSVIALDGAGSHWLKYGSARRHVKALRVVLADGHVIHAGREPLVEGASQDPDPRKRELIDGLVRLLTDNAKLIRANPSQSPVNRCGYRLAEILGEDYLDLAGLLTGSEGTLALIVEATLAVEPLPRRRGVTLLLFDSLDTASRAVMEILPFRPTACDLMDRRHLSLAREAEPRFDLLIPAVTEAALLVEVDGSRQVEVRDRLHELVDHVTVKRRLALGSRQAFDPAEVDLFWHLGRKITPALYRTKGNVRPVPVMEDVAVPPNQLPEFLVQVQNLFKRHQAIGSMYCHAGQGQIHLQPFLNLASAEDVQKMQRLTEDLYEAVFAAAGTISGEHGCGLSRSPFVRRQYGELYDVFVEVKRLFDPKNLLNPGKIVGDTTALVARSLRPTVHTESEGAPTADETPPLRNLVELQLSWNPGPLADVVRACNGCGECRSQASDVRMCPMFRVLPAEEASPRSKANLIRGMLTGQIGLQSLTSPAFKATADLCIHCHMCALECPAQVDIPKLMSEAKGAYVAAKGLSVADAFTAQLDRWIALASHFSAAVNWALGNRQMRWLLEKTLGIAHARKLPRLSSRSFLRRAARKRLTRPSRRSGHKVALFVDTFANYFDPQLPEALVAVLEHNGIVVYVPPEQRQAGMPAVACGALDKARLLAQHNIEVLADAVRQGYHVVTTEPAAALCLIREYPNLLDHDDARLVAKNTSEACTYLWRMHTLGRLQLDLQPINLSLGYHMPCRLKALGVGSPGENLLRLIPGLTVQHLEEGCSGMAGTFGLKRENFRTSLRIGRNLVRRLRDPNLQAGTTECSTCMLQMEQGANKPTIHPLKLFAHSYGLMPQVAKLLSHKERTVL
jgi:FAD/FMN-containing dehydrogenase/Fe-S oxidoreductase